MATASTVMTATTALHGWGRYPRLDAQVALPLSATQCVATLASNAPLIAHGLGRSYGDSALAAQVLDTRYLDHFAAFDAQSGVLTCQAGVYLRARSWTCASRVSTVARAAGSRSRPSR